jgi:hypothetical protein
MELMYEKSYEDMQISLLMDSWCGSACPGELMEDMRNPIFHEKV